MREITSKQQTEKKKNRNQLIVGLILIAIMFMSVVGYSFQGRGEGDSSTKITYNSFEFVKQNDFWIVSINSNNFVFKYNPEETEKIKGNVMPLNNYYNKPLYISSENSEAELEIYRNLNPFVQRMQKACLEGEKCELNLPIKNCSDNFIIIQKNESSRIYQQENCVFIEGKQGNLTKLSDEFLFKIFGIEE